jgi:hypothetical protein
MHNFNKYLQFNREDVLSAEEIRVKSIDNALLLKKGPSRKSMIHHVLWSTGNYEVGVGKPGKETETANKVNPNVNDMWPFIKKNGSFVEKSASFSDIFSELEHMANHSRYSLELLGCLLVRSAFMLDHEIIDKQIVYKPPKEVLLEIRKDITQMFGVPLEVFLQYLDLIALNEDVKYQRRLNTKGKPYGKNAGRPNNLLTCAHLIAVLLGRTGIVRFATGFAQQRGVSAISYTQAQAYFPMVAVVATNTEIVTIS